MGLYLKACPRTRGFENQNLQPIEKIRT